MKRATANLPLHGGNAPRWLFQRMERLAGAITQLVVDRYGPGEMLEGLADPVWFQAFGCVLGFDWHSSGLPTVTCGAMRQAHLRMGGELGIHVAGGKGGTSRETPQQIEQIGEKGGLDLQPLVYASRMSAKVDSAAVQDGHPFPVDRALYDRNIGLLEEAVARSKVNPQEKDDALGRLSRYLSG